MVLIQKNRSSRVDVEVGERYREGIFLFTKSIGGETTESEIIRVNSRGKKKK